MIDFPSLSFFLAAIPAVMLVGLSKGGIGGAIGLMGVPIMSLAVEPVQAAAIFLPILILMDAVALWSWRKYNDPKTLLMIMPGGVIGIALGWATSAYVSDDALKVVIASATILFAARYFWQVYGRRGEIVAPLPHRPVAATFWGSLSGYASFVAHAGGPPFQIYVLPMQLDPKNYTGASIRFFAIVNAVKVIPYFFLGALDTQNLTLSATLLPVALVSTIMAAAVVKHLKAETFYPMTYGLAFLAGLKLLWDGLPF
ncbi:Sulfite exporter TauE/SafE [compost metagenome]